MAMSKRSGGEKQEDIWIAHTELAVAPGHPFYKRLNELLEGAGFDEFVEGLCARFYHARLGRPSLRPGVYFRALLVGYFEGIDSERGIGWRVARANELWPCAATRSDRVHRRDYRAAYASLIDAVLAGMEPPRAGLAKRPAIVNARAAASSAN
jgi:hypothetical protein